MAPPTLQQVARCLFTWHYSKAALALFNPSLAQEHTDFCLGCNLNTDAGHATAQYEMAQSLFIAMIYTAASHFESERALKNVICWGTVLPLGKLYVLATMGQASLGEGSVFMAAVAENVALFTIGLICSKMWHKRAIGKMGSTSSKFELYSEKTAAQVALLEAALLGGYAVYNIVTGESNKFRAADASAYGSHMMAATLIGKAAMFYAVSACDHNDVQMVLKYNQYMMGMRIFYLTVLAAPFAIAAGSVDAAYMNLTYTLVPLIHTMAVLHGSPSGRKLVFWTGSLMCFFLGALGLFYPASTSVAMYKMTELSGVSDTVLRLIGMGLTGFGAALMCFAGSYHTDDFEIAFAKVYGSILLVNMYQTQGLNLLELGVFSDLLNLFLIWSLYINYSKLGLRKLKALIPFFLRKPVNQVVAAVSPKASPMKMKGRNKTPMRKSK